MNASDWFALTALVISAATMGWTLHRDLTTKVKLKLRCYVGQIMDLGDPNAANETEYLVFQITNVDSRPVIISSAGGLRKGNKGFIIKTQGLPRKLEPGDSHNVWTTDLSVLDDDLRSLVVHDSASQCYTFGHRKTRQLVKAQKTT
ncbi:MAG TPA: hypothetical protein VM425_21045 [Myxococcota bacterium]|nr:hypothetical protein [Myxococcota bacterium]